MTSPSPIQTTSHLVTIPHPPCPYFLVQILHLQQSLSISIFPSPNPALVPGLLPPVSNGSSEGANKTEPNEEALDLELAKALEESGRIQPSVQPPSSSTNAIQDQLPLPRLSKEWSVAMIPPNSGKVSLAPRSLLLFLRSQSFSSASFLCISSFYSLHHQLPQQLQFSELLPIFLVQCLIG